MSGTGGYCDCACRDCFEIAIGRAGYALCHACEAAGCEPNAGACERGDAYCDDDDDSEARDAHRREHLKGWHTMSPTERRDVATEHVRFLESTLIPESRRSGHDPTAEALQLCVLIIRGYRGGEL